MAITMNNKYIVVVSTDHYWIAIIIFINTTPHWASEQTVKTCGELCTHTFMPLKKVIRHLNLDVRKNANNDIIIPVLFSVYAILGMYVVAVYLNN